MLPFVMLLSLALAGADGEDWLAKAKDQYLNKKVIVKSAAFHKGSLKDGAYQSEFVFLPDSYRGQTATVIAVQPRGDYQPAKPKLNALGEPISTPQPEPHLDFVVQFTDGYIAMIYDTPSGMRTDVISEEEAAKLEEQERQREAKAKLLVGRTVYATAFSRVYRPDVTTSEMQPKNAVWVPYLRPLKIQAAKWDHDSGCVVVKLELPEAAAGLALVPLELADAHELDEVRRCGGSEFLPWIPKSFTPVDIAGIREVTARRGMSSLAVYYALGAPDTENDYGRAGRQLIYPGGLIVYTNQADRVEDVQRMGR